ncbi:hypothetical protein ABK040_016442 [Willaertia magna]
MDTNIFLQDNIFSYWLCFVSLFRGFSIVTGYFKPQIITKNIYPNEKLPPLFGRMFANWTGGSITACLILALFPQSLPMHYMNLCAFTIAFGHALLESNYYKTMPFKGAISMYFFGGGSALWTLYRILFCKSLQ